MWRGPIPYVIIIMCAVPSSPMYQLAPVSPMTSAGPIMTIRPGAVVYYPLNNAAVTSSEMFIP